MGSLDTFEVLESIQEYLKTELPGRIAAEPPELCLKPIQEWDIGYRDVVSGLHAHPALLIKSDADYESSDGRSFHTLELDIALVNRCEDQDLGYRQLCRYQSILDTMLRDDPHFGGNIAEAKRVRFQKARDATRGGLFFLFVELDIDIDVIAWRS